MTMPANTATPGATTQVPTTGQPLVSICLPNLNNRPYLPERLDSIRRQTFTDWELIVFDSYSGDGAWEFLTAAAAREPRMRVSQAPRGLYENWNNCVREARGRYVYFATSDDTMADDFLERMVAALESNPDCGLAHSPLKTFDAEGRELPDNWSTASMFGCNSGDLIGRPHRRMAPHDGLLHLAGRSVYTSITQLLIRRSVFADIGEFSTRWGSMGDVHWNMRASLRHSTVHVPGTWGGWRQHATQATSQAGSRTPQHQARIRDLIEDVLGGAAADLSPEINRFLAQHWRPWFESKLRFEEGFVGRRGAVTRLGFLAQSLLGPDRGAAWDFLRGRLSGNRAKIDCGRLQRLGREAGLTDFLAPAVTVPYCQPS
jgi:hypothetical protein